MRPKVSDFAPVVWRLVCPRMTDLFDQLVDWLRIPSISTGGGDPAEIRRAAQWAADHVERAGGTAELVTIGDGNPLAIGDLQGQPPRRARPSSSTATTTSRARAT